MSVLPFLSSARCILIIGDESLYIYETGGNSTRLIDTIPWTTRDFEGTVSDTIRRECRGKSVLVMNDMTDQHFKGGQRIPKVQPLDRANVIARRLNMAFPNYPIRGALQIRDRAGKAATAANAAGGLYLFAAVPMSEPVSKTLAALKLSMSSITGFVLLPVEASDMVRALADKVMKQERTNSRWAVFMGQHLNGSLRQVITRDGQLAMTRMTPISDLDGDSTAWVNDVAQEFKATLSYLTRFGYSSDDGMEVFAIATPSAGEDLQAQIGSECNFHHYTASEAANILGIRLGLQDDQYHADALHAAWAGKKKKFILPMDAVDVKRIHAPRKAATIAAALLFCSGLYLTWMLMSQTGAWVSARGELDAQRKDQTEVEAQYDAEVKRLEALGFDVRLIRSSLDSFKRFDAESLHPMALIQDIGKAVGADLRLDRLSVAAEPVKPAVDSAGRPLPNANPNEVKAGTFTATLTFSFPYTIEPEEGIRQVNQLQQRLVSELPSTYAVEVVKQVADLSYTDSTVGAVGSPGVAPSVNTTAENTEDYKAEITIKGPLL